MASVSEQWREQLQQGLQQTLAGPGTLAGGVGDLHAFGERVLKVGVDVFERLVPKKREQTAWGKDNNSRIRRLFVKTVKKKAKGKVSKTLSAREMAAEYEIENPLLVSLYEKARYSGKQCSDEETTSVE